MYVALQRPHRGVLRRDVAVPDVPGGAIPEVHHEPATALGYLPLSFNLDGDESIWIHAVSVGEVLTARALLPELRERYPQLRIFLSTTTMTGQQIAAKQPAVRRQVFYFPFDLGFVVNRTLRLVKPRLFIMMETEIWPNLLRACHRARREDGAGQRPDLRALVSALPARRARSSAACCAHVDRFCMQSDESARRIIDIGAAPRARRRHRLAEVRLARVPRRDGPPTAVPHDRSRPQPRAALFPHEPRSPGRHRREHAQGRRGSGARSLPPDSRVDAERAARHRAAKAGAVRRCRAAGSRAPGYTVARRTELRVDAEPRQQVVDPRHDWRAGAALSDRHGGLRRRQPRGRWRPQYPGACGLREANRLWSAHAEFRGDCADVPRQRRGDPSPGRSGSSSRC